MNPEIPAVKCTIPAPAKSSKPKLASQPSSHYHARANGKISAEVKNVKKK